MTPAARLHNELLEASKDRFTKRDEAYVALLARVCDALAELDRRQRGEITPEMLQAGLFALSRLSGSADEYELVSEVYTAMASHRPA